MPHSYLGVASLKSSITLAAGDTTDDARLRAVLEAVSQQIDDECQRTFRVYLATVYLTAQRSDRLLLPFDLLELTSLKTDDDGDRTYDETWVVSGASADVDLLPYDAPMRREPYWELAIAPNGDYSFPVGAQKGVELVVKAGYREDLLTLTATLNEALDATEPGVDLTVVTEVEVAQTILIDSEQMYITALSGNTATVERGVNGTTAAAHNLGAAVKLYRYPGPIVEATRIQAARINQRVHAPFGVTGSAEFGTVVIPGRMDSDVRMLISHYRSALGMVA